MFDGGVQQVLLSSDEKYNVSSCRGAAHLCYRHPSGQLNQRFMARCNFLGQLFRYLPGSDGFSGGSNTASLLTQLFNSTRSSHTAKLTSQVPHTMNDD